MMTTVDATTLSSDTTRGRGTGERAGRPALFALLLLAASVIVIGVLVAGPAIPVAGSVGLSTGALALVGAGWALAGPRW